MLCTVKKLLLIFALFGITRTKMVKELELTKSKHFFTTILILIVGAVCLLSGCTEGEIVPDVAHIEATPVIHRMEQKMFAIDTNAAKTGIKNLEKEHPHVMDIFLRGILQVKGPRDTSGKYYEYMEKDFLKPLPVRKLYDTTQIVFKNFNKIEKEFEEAFKYYKYYFPKDSLPEVYTFISEYGLAVGVDENKLYVGLDMFLGQSYPYYYGPPVNLHYYLMRSQNPDHLVAKSLAALIDDKVGVPKGNRLLDYMISNGKKLYILDKILPYTSDTIVFDYSKKQLEWCNDNELEMWTFFIGEDLLYSTKMQEFIKYVSPSPSAPGMPREAPGRTGNFMGYQIVKKYMERNPEQTMEDLIGERDAQKLMDESRYKPRR